MARIYRRRTRELLRRTGVPFRQKRASGSLRWLALPALIRSTDRVRSGLSCGGLQGPHALHRVELLCSRPLVKPLLFPARHVRSCSGALAAALRGKKEDCGTNEARISLRIDEPGCHMAEKLQPISSWLLSLPSASVEPPQFERALRRSGGARPSAQLPSLNSLCEQPSGQTLPPARVSASPTVSSAQPIFSLELRHSYDGNLVYLSRSVCDCLHRPVGFLLA